MSLDVDERLTNSFTPQRVVDAYIQYKHSKWDHLSTSEMDSPRITIPMGADGVTFEAFEKQLYRHARNIARRVQNGTYSFYPFREVEVEKEPAANGKSPKFRTLSIASIRDALVQSILYQDVVYQPLEALFAKLDQPYPVSFAYRKGRSAPQASKNVYDFAQSGYWHVFDADLSRYFDTIPHNDLMKRLYEVIGASGMRTCTLLKRFICVDRVPFDTYKSAKWNGRKVGYKIFQKRKPTRCKREAGVPQGGVLSGMLANLYLHSFDEWVVTKLSLRIDIKYVRYADDFVILARSPAVLSDIHSEVRKQIELLGLSLNEDKTKHIDIRQEGLDFVGFSFDEEHMRIRERNVRKYQTRVIEDVIKPRAKKIDLIPDPKIALRSLAKHLRYKVHGVSDEEPCPKCGYTRVGEPRSWIAFFQAVTDNKQLHMLDKWTRKQAYAFMYDNYGIRISRKRLRRAGLRSLINEKYRLARTRRKPCLCDIEEYGVWPFVSDIFQGRKLRTLALRRPFLITKVTKRNIHLSVGTRKYLISKNAFGDLWTRLETDKQLVRANLERDGYKNTSHLFALLAELPGVQISYWPLRLSYSGPRPSAFLAFRYPD